MTKINNLPGLVTKTPAALWCTLGLLLMGTTGLHAQSEGSAMVAWGHNQDGQTTIPANLGGVIAIKAGLAHTVALKTNGVVVAWGLNSSYQTDVPAGMSGVTAIGAGDYHTVALKTNGTVVAWGLNSSRQTSVPAGLSGVMAIAAGFEHTVALKTNGTVVAWGRNDGGQTNIPSGLIGVMAIAAGSEHTVALKSNGTVVAWGGNYYGATTVPVSAKSGVTAIAAGIGYTVALKTNGTVVAWGRNDLGLTNVPATLSGVRAIAGGGLHIVALKTNGAVVAWGNTNYGQANTPSGVSGVTAIAAGGYHTVALVPVLITVPPQSKTVALDGTAVFTVTATGTPVLGYQWRKEGSAIAGATNNSLIVPDVTPSDAGNYDVMVTNHYGSVTSSNVVLQVLPANAPSITVNGLLAVGTVNVGTAGSIKITGGYAGGLIFYTFDGSVPTTSATLYTGPFSITNSVTLRATSLSADFTQNSEAPPINVTVLPVYSLATSVSGSGEITASPPNGPYISNSVVSLTAQPYLNWAFDHWSGALSGSVNPAYLTMNGPRSVQAVFVPTAYPLTAGTPGGGSVTANGQSIAANTYYPTGSVVLLEATANSGWSFLRWQGTTSSVANPLNSFMNQTQNVQAIFGTMVSSNIAGSGSIAVSAPNPVPFGTLLTLTATPSPGYYFLSWSGAVGGTLNPTNLTVTTASPMVGALFAVSTEAAILTQPTNLTVWVSNSATFYVMGSGAAPLSYQWRKSGANLNEQTNALYTITNTVAGDGGNYDVVVVNAYGNSVTSAVATLTVLVPVTITSQPVQQVVPLRGSATFTGAATGYPTPSYQWLFNGAALPGANASSLVVTNVDTHLLGDYSLLAWNAYTAATSSVARLLMSPSLRVPFVGDTVVWGKSAVLAVAALGSGELSFQWFKDGAPLTWGTNATLEFSTIQISDGGLYSVVVSSEWGSVTNTPAQLVINPANIRIGIYAGITIEGVPGYTYGIQYTTDLTDTNSWATLTNHTLTQPAEIWVDTSVEVGTALRRYYRVSAP